MDKVWSIELFKDTITQYAAPQIHNSDQKSQYTSTQYIDVLRNHKIQISLDGKGSALDNIYIERFWKSITYEKSIWTRLMEVLTYIKWSMNILSSITQKEGALKSEKYHQTNFMVLTK